MDCNATFAPHRTYHETGPEVHRSGSGKGLSAAGSMTPTGQIWQYPILSTGPNGLDKTEGHTSRTYFITQTFLFVIYI